MERVVVTSLTPDEFREIIAQSSEYAIKKAHSSILNELKKELAELRRQLELYQNRPAVSPGDKSDLRA